jgi:hypothetical protein
MPEKPSETPYRHLDIGGGPDRPSHEEMAQLPVSEERHRYEMRALEGLRAAKLAKANPEGQYLVIDPNLPEPQAAYVQGRIPNLLFVRGKTEHGHGLPISDNSIDTVEINHLFFPLLSSRHLQPLERDIPKRLAERQAAIASAAPGMINHLVIQKQVLQYENELLAEISRLAEELENSGGAEDFRDFVATLAEASRILKPGGSVIIAEKRSRLDAIRRVLSKDAGLKCDGELMGRLHLQMAAYKENTESTRSAYAEAAGASEERQREWGNDEAAESMTPMLLELEKYI